MFTTVRLRLGGVVAAALLAMTAAAGAATGRSRLRHLQPGQARPGAGRHGRLQGRPCRPASGPRASRATSPGATARAPRTCGTPPSAASPRSAGPAAATRSSATARSCRCATTTACAGAATTTTASAGRSRGNWLDSNDNRGIKWRIKDVGKFDTIGFFVSDVADVGGKFSIKVGDTVYRDIADGAKLKNGNIHFVRILLVRGGGQADDQAQHDIADDGFGIDGAGGRQLGAGPAAAGRGAAPDRPARPLRPAPARRPRRLSAAARVPPPRTRAPSRPSPSGPQARSRPVR